MTRSLNKATLIGNLTRDPELRYTPQGTAVCTFSVATNRQWTTDQGEKKEDVEFHRVVAWNKLAEICANLLRKGRKVYVEGRLQTRSWETKDGQPRQTTEIVISEMLILDPKGASSTESSDLGMSDSFDDGPDLSETEASSGEAPKNKKEDQKEDKKLKKSVKTNSKNGSGEDEDEIPF